jgi:uncharacterized protein
MSNLYLDHSINDLKAFYKRVEAMTSALEVKHANRLMCKKGCHACCLDDLEVFGVEAALIESENQAFLKLEKPHAPGKCAFLDNDGGCRIYEQRPFVCRTHGLPISWLEEIEDETFECRDICELNEAGEPLENLVSEDLLQLPSLDEQLAIIQLKADGGNGHRVKLRSLFLVSSY